MTTLASLTTGTDALERLPGSHRLASGWCGSAKGMRRDWSGTGTGTRASLRLTSLLFLLGEELYRQPRAVSKYWAGGYVPVTMQRQVPAVLRVRLVSVDRHVLDIPVMLQRHVSVVPLCRSRCASFSGHGRPCDPSKYVEVPQFPSSTECYRFQLYYSVVYVQCKLCKHRGFHSAVLGLVVHAPVVMLRQLLVVGQCRKLWKFRSCRWCSSWWF